MPSGNSAPCPPKPDQLKSSRQGSKLLQLFLAIFTNFMRKQWQFFSHKFLLIQSKSPIYTFLEEYYKNYNTDPWPKIVPLELK
jgi:hypothetical protein